MALAALLSRLRDRARFLKGEAIALYVASRDPRTPRWLKWFLLAVLAYAFSPIDLIPDFIPVLGMLDELILLPLAIGWAVRHVPPQVMQDARIRATQVMARGKPVMIWGAVVIVLLWLAILGGLLWLIIGAV